MKSSSKKQLFRVRCVAFWPSLSPSLFLNLTLSYFATRAAKSLWELPENNLMLFVIGTSCLFFGDYETSRFNWLDGISI